MPSHVEPTSSPSGVTAPSPVTATRRRSGGIRSATQLSVHHVDRLANSHDRLGLLIRDLHPELVFEGHEKLHDAQAVHIEVLLEMGLLGDLGLFQPELRNEHLTQPVGYFIS